MFNYCHAKPLTKTEPIRQPGWEISVVSVTFQSGTHMQKYSKRCGQCVQLMNLSHSVPRIYSDYHDLGRVRAACCHDSHPGGECILIQSVYLTLIRVIKNIHNIWVEQLYLFE